ncbi:MAG: NUDIX hydrolase [Acidimicrobiales bacterium]|nr:NUDIX hydrolase [Acidimicrobiales bacterium]
MVADEFSAHSVPVSPAATVLVLRDHPDLQVLMVRRTRTVAFAPDAWVFPGGRVDAADFDSSLFDACDQLSDADASRRLDVDDGGLAWWVAAAREVLEESTILLGESPRMAVPDLAAQLRTAPDSFASLVKQQEVRFDCSLVQEVARFITPLGPPRRFDARFFVARMPEGQEAMHDDGEIVDLKWVNPIQALSHHAKGTFGMISPTIRMLRTLERFTSVAHVMEVAAECRPYQTIRVADPDGEYRVLLPGDEGYDSASGLIEKGHIRLYL